jgi:hypothetical protein
MPLDLAAKIQQMIRGNDLDVIRTVSGIPTGQTITDGWLRVNVPASSTQLFEKHVTPTLVAGEGQVEDTGSGDGIGLIRFEVTAVNSLLMTGGTALAPVNHAYGVQVKTSGGKIYEFEQGVFECVEQVVVSA